MFVSFTFRLSLDCSACHMAMPINGFAETVACYHCGEAHALGPAFWTDAIDKDNLAEAAGMGEGEGKVSTVMGRRKYELAYGRRTPRCQSCKGPDLDVAMLAQFAATGHCFCPACGHEIRVRAADDLVHAIDARATLVVGETTLDAAAQAATKRTKPMLFACMGCSAGLTVDGRTRAVTCQYCQASNYLPDGLWQQLNPVPKATVWFMICDYDELALRELRWANEDARIADARSPATPPELLARLARDEDDDVVAAALANPALPPEVAWELAATADDDAVVAMLGNPTLGAPIVERAATHADYRVRVAAARHPSLSLAKLHELAHDSDSDVERAAKDRLAELRAQGVDIHAGRGFFARLRD